MTFSRIYATGSYVPEERITNAYFEKYFGTDLRNGGTTDEWIREHVGIIERRRASKPEETHQYMATRAIEDALRKADINPKRANLILTGNTHKPERAASLIPCRASEIQDHNKLNRARGYEKDIPAFDIITNNVGATDIAVGAASHLLNSCTMYTQGHNRFEPRMLRNGRDGVAFWHQDEGLAQKIAKELGMQKESSFDLVTGCASFNYGLALADMLVSRTREYAVVAAVDKMWDATDHNDRKSIILFGELAGAAVIGPSEQPGFIKHLLRTDGSQRETITAKQLNGQERLYFWQDGKAVYKWALRAIVEETEFFVKNSEGRRVVVPHQANPRLLELVKKHKIFRNNIADTIVTGDMFGNSSTASIAHALDEAFKTERIKPGDYVGISGFGAGLSDAMNVYRAV